LPLIPFNKVVDPERIIRKMEGRGGGEAQEVADPKKEITACKKNPKQGSPNVGRVLEHCSHFSEAFLVALATKMERRG
jgi:hypothetical protein